MNEAGITVRASLRQQRSDGEIVYIEAGQRRGLRSINTCNNVGERSTNSREIVRDARNGKVALLYGLVKGNEVGRDGAGVAIGDIKWDLILLVDCIAGAVVFVKGGVLC